MGNSEVIIEPNAPSEGYGADGDLIGAGSRSIAIQNACFPQRPMVNETDIASDATQAALYLGTVKSDNTITDQFPKGISMKYSDAPVIGSDWTVGLGEGGVDEFGVTVGGGVGITRTILGRKWPIPNLNSSPGTPTTNGGHLVGAVPAFQTKPYVNEDPLLI